ncbi:hypothetical protein JRQ81_012045 [Phrynocephalus forsythii]|uniref:Uncharacterized protein n=1 Tax=Phrynocephalus forsythii TaxID=171643 RepID=A0A9Q0XA64_9SAUR|nr:hypothetical protein JRQ81_012045 [Phrynocephalus forsythii]
MEGVPRGIPGSLEGEASLREVKKTGPRFVAGCSNKCQGSGPTCSPRPAAQCYQECCRAMPQASCLKLDGRAHFDGAGPLASTPWLRWLALLAFPCLALSCLPGPN